VSDDRCDLLCLDLPRAEDIRQHLNEATIADAAARATALGDPTRVTIAVALREGGELCVCDLAWITRAACTEPPGWERTRQHRRCHPRPATAPTQHTARDAPEPVRARDQNRDSCQV
jgi:hypothetical protein